MATTLSPHRQRSLLLPVAAGAGAALIVASWAGLARIGFDLGNPPISIHGPLMILGFLGTVISAERAVGLGGRWPWAAPLLSALGVVLLLAGLTTAGVAAQLGAGVVLVVVYLVALRIGQFPPYLMVEGMGAVAWVVATASLLTGRSIPQVVPLLVAFLILTIIGERIELSRLGPARAPGETRGLLLSSLAVLVAASFAVFVFGPATRAMGAAMVVLAVLSALGDVARRTIRTEGVTRYMAAAILGGYVWLVIAGVLWVGGAVRPGTATYDPALHSVLIGFVLSMVLAHAPVIVPAVARIALPFHPSWWVALASLHLSLLVRLVGSLGGVEDLRVWGGAGNVAALALFMVLAATSALIARGTT